MSTPESRRDDLVAAILRVTADVAARKVAFAAGVAERLGLAGADVDVLTALASEGAMTVGRIGELTGLTTGATTRMVDRLEQAGFVRRVADPADRRRVIVEPAGDRASAVARAYQPLEEAGRLALGSLDDTALEAVHAYLVAFAAGIPTEAAARESAASAGDGGEAGAGATAPLAGATAGRLVFVTGAPAVTITGAADLGQELYRAHFSGATPSARVRDGAVTIRYPRFAWFDWRARVGDQWMSASAHWRRDATELALNAALPWSIDLRGGATSLVADLRGIRLGGLDLRGGAGSVQLTLDRPQGVVRIRVRGGAGDVLVTRPAGTPTILDVRGGHRGATLDGIAMRAGARLVSSSGDTASDRLEVEVTGGANRVTVREG